MPEAVVAITGASGALYAERLLRSLSESDWDVLLIVTSAGAINLDLELSLTPDDLGKMKGVTLEDNDNLAARSASGSARIDHYVICPASGTTIGKLAAGISDNLVTRSALENAASIAKNILTTEAIVAEPADNEPMMPGGPPDMGGMGGMM